MSTKTTYKQTELGLIPEDWEVKKIDDVLDIFPTASYSRAEQSEDGEVQYIHYGDIHTKYNFHLKIDNNNLPKISIDKLKNYKTLEIGDLIMADASEDYEGVGKSVEILELSDKKAIAGLHTFLLRDKKQNFSLGFKGYMTTSGIVKKQFYRIAVGTKVYSLSKSSLQNLKIPLPPLPEQKKIANCLSTWDKAINNLQLIIENLQLRKKALMQQLLTGKKRLPGFEGKWELKSIEELFTFKNGKAHENVIDENGKYILINSKFISTNGDVLKRTNSNLVPLVKNDLVFVMSDVPNGKALAKFFLVDENDLYTLNQRIGLLKIKKGNPVFMYYLLNRNSYFLTFDNGVGQTNLRKDDVLECPLNVPTLEEQTAIAEILATADRELQLQKERLAQLQTQKKGLMQVLLTGKVRLIN